MLNDTRIRNAKPIAKTRRLADERGLVLEVAPSGGKWWRFRYRFDGTEKMLSLGVYPDVGLKAARKRRDELRTMLADNVDPGAARAAERAARADRVANSFETVAREWFAKFSPAWAPGHRERVSRRLEADLFPWIGAIGIAELTAPQLLEVLRRIEGRGAVDTAHRARGDCGVIFRYAIATGRAERDPSADLRGAIPPARAGHFAAVTDPARVGALLRAFESYRGSLVVASALRLAPLVFVRPGELRGARWTDIDLETAEWRFVSSKTKMPHVTPLSTQAVAILRDLRPKTGRGDFVFPSLRSSTRPMSEGTILVAMRSCGIPKEEMSGHGWRATARTLLDEILHVRPDLIEAQLAHAVRDANGRAYNRTSFLPERRDMMQKWADYLDRLKAGAK